MSIISLPSLFTDGMVLQQGMPAPVWGRATDGARITVRIQGHKATATARNGRWRATLNPLDAGGPFEMTIAAAVAGATETLTLHDVLVGEVWVCGGQSNMQWPVVNSEDPEPAIAASANPRIRLFKVPMTGADEPRDDVDARWTACAPETVRQFSAVGYFFGRALERDRGVPIGLIQSAMGGTKVESWMSREAVKADPELRFILDDYTKAVARLPEATKQYIAAKADWEKRAAEARARGVQPPPPGPIVSFGPMGPAHPKRPFALYNGMIRPLQPYAIRGAIWYQGESDADIALAYRHLFPAMIANWRRDWRQGDFPFLFVQLPGFQPPAARDWPLLREAQLMTLSRSPNMAMAIVIDLGEPHNIHPLRKAPVGERLALAARGTVYGERIVHSGPISRSKKIDGAKMMLRFRHAGGGLVCGRKEEGKPRDRKLKGFAIAGKDGVFVEARARIVAGGARDTVIVSSPKVKQPVAVRYAWANDPDCNLYNKEGLPASPFRTDDWPIGPR